MSTVTFGTLDPKLRDIHGLKIFESAGPVSDAFMRSTGSMDLINGPVGSGKTTTAIKRALYSATRMPPIGGRRRYVLGVWREKYDQLWSGTIKSWWRVLPPETFGGWTGTRGRGAEHRIEFEDAFGPIEFLAIFRAFGEAMDEDDTKGLEFTDCYLNEADTFPEGAVTNLIGRVGRDPPETVTGRPGRIFSDCNAPAITSPVYRDFFEVLRPGYRLFRQPGGLEPNAENQAALGRGYYERLARLNAHRRWWVRAMVHNQPGYQRDADVVYPAFDDDEHVSAQPLAVYPELPIVVGIDGGLTPAAVYQQELPNGQVRWLAEICITRGGATELAEAMLAYEAQHFRECEFFDVCDPAMDAGADTRDGSSRQRLEKVLGRPVRLGATNVLDTRVTAVAELLKRRTGDGQIGFLLDGTRCRQLRRGFNQTYTWRKIQGTAERSGIVKNPDSHPHDAGQYAALEVGQSHARKRRSAMAEERKRRREAARNPKERKRYNPLERR